MNAPVSWYGARGMTLSRDAVVEASLAAGLRAAGDDLRAQLGPRGLRALVLVGSAARGEAGVVMRGGKPIIDNDLDFIALVDHPRRRSRTLTTWARDWTERLGTEVDVWGVTSARWYAPPATLFWLDVTQGGARMVVGENDWLRCLPTRSAAALPAEERGRLLSNRATGLALSSLPGRHAERSVRARHAHKAVLACGEALLLSKGDYPGRLSDRLDRLVRLGAEAYDLAEAYADALRFRVRPDRWTPKSSFGNWYAGTVALCRRWHLELEARRTGAPALVDAWLSGPWRRMFPARVDSRRFAGPLRSVQAMASGCSRVDAEGWHHPRERLARVSLALAYGDAKQRRVGMDLLGADDEADAHRRLLRLVRLGS